MKCPIKPGSLECEECDDWVLVTEAVRIDGIVKVKLREKCKRILFDEVSEK